MQVDPAGAGSAGLGLAIVKRVAQHWAGCRSSPRRAEDQGETGTRTRPRVPVRVQSEPRTRTGWGLLVGVRQALGAIGHDPGACFRVSDRTSLVGISRPCRCTRSVADLTSSAYCACRAPVPPHALKTHLQTEQRLLQDDQVTGERSAAISPASSKDRPPGSSSPVDGSHRRSAPHRSSSASLPARLSARPSTLGQHPWSPILGFPTSGHVVQSRPAATPGPAVASPNPPASTAICRPAEQRTARFLRPTPITQGAAPLPDQRMNRPWPKSTPGINEGNGMTDSFKKRRLRSAWRRGAVPVFVGKPRRPRAEVENPPGRLGRPHILYEIQYSVDLPCRPHPCLTGRPVRLRLTAGGPPPPSHPPWPRPCGAVTPGSRHGYRLAQRLRRAGRRAPRRRLARPPADRSPAPPVLAAEWRLAGPSLRRVVADGAAVAMIGPPKRPHPPGLMQLGGDERHLVWIDARAPSERLWCAEQLIRCWRSPSRAPSSCSAAVRAPRSLAGAAAAAGDDRRRLGPGRPDPQAQGPRPRHAAAAGVHPRRAGARADAARDAAQRDAAGRAARAARADGAGLSGDPAAALSDSPRAPTPLALFPELTDVVGSR
ncbi:hypothetical protein Ddc_19755 [Ditylenchus destructor]|nr:hypothetical protein Ddc_19755 [Ditylenchus destructor]